MQGRLRALRLSLELSPRSGNGAHMFSGDLAAHGESMAGGTGVRTSRAFDLILESVSMRQ